MEKLLLLHGALGTRRQFGPLQETLSADFEVFTLDFSGHGEQPLPEAPFSIPLFCQDVVRFLDEKKIPSVSIFGYSMGGYVALYLARHFPEKVNKVFTLGTKFEWTEEIAIKETRKLDPAKILEKVPAYAKHLALLHGQNNWVTVLGQTALLMTGLGRQNALKKEDFLQIGHTVKVGLGDQDEMVGRAETKAVSQWLRNGSFALLPGTPHPLEKVDTRLLAKEIRAFF